MKFANLKIGRRMGVGFAVLLAFLVTVTLLGIAGMDQIESRLKKIAEQNNLDMRSANTIRITSFERALAVRNLHIGLLTDLQTTEKTVDSVKQRTDRIAREAERVRKERAIFKDALKVLERSYAANPEKPAGERALVTRIAELDTLIVPLEDKLLESIRAEASFDASIELLNNVTALLRQSTEATTVFGVLLEQQNVQAVKDADQAFLTACMWMIGLSAAALLIGSLFAWRVANSISRPINHAVQIARTVAQGDLTSHIEVVSADETGQLMQSLIDMSNSLGKIVREVRSGTHSIAATAQQIVDGNLDLSARTEQQASSLEETASTMEELTSTVRQNAESARQADKVVASATAVAVKGGEVVAQVVQTMSSINDSAHKIVDIIGVIDGIAFQTNILALNAAVEAARAGEQGRGFAVVAAEVRSLAQRSAAAAKEIKVLIDDSVNRVVAGNKLVAQAGSTMEEVAASVKRVSDIMSEITYASQEQSAGIEQVNQAITQIDQVTQQNAALVEEAAAAAESMQELARSLMHSVSLFKLNDSEAADPQIQAARPVQTVARAPALRRAALRTAVTPKQVSRTPAALTRNDDWEEF